MALHPRPSPPHFGAQDWHFTVTSDAGGRVAPRQVLVRYQHPHPENPERVPRDGMILIAVTIFATFFGLLFLVAMGPQAVFGDAFTSFGGFVLVAFPVGLLAAWWALSARQLLRASANRRSRHTMHGVVIERSSTVWQIAEGAGTYELHYLALDDGTGELVEGWEVPREVYDRFPLGTEAEAEISGDRRYPYSIAHADSPDGGQMRLELPATVGQPSGVEGAAEFAHPFAKADQAEAT